MSGVERELRRDMAGSVSALNENMLPRGLLEFRASLADPYDAARLLPRLADLGEFGMTDQMRRHQQIMDEINSLRQQLSEAMGRARAVAESIFDGAVKNWSIEELQEATGYKN